MRDGHFLALQALVFTLVTAAFTNIYITQPVLPVLSVEFGINESTASFSVSAVILGIALSNLPFGRLADRYPIKPIILTGGCAIALAGLVCAATKSFWILTGARFFQGLFIPGLTTCLAAYLAKHLPAERLNVALGAYVAATVIGGLSGRLLGGWIHPPLHWRYAFVSASILILIAVVAAAAGLPAETAKKAEQKEVGFIQLLSRPDLLRIYLVSFSSFFVFSSTFNYLPFYLSGPPFNANTRIITLLYLAYIIGIIIAPLSGKLSNKIGNGATMAWGSLIFGCFLGCTLITSLAAIVAGLAGICGGFFMVHSAAAGALNRKLSASRGRANSLYVLFYYSGGTVGITLSGYGYMYAGWAAIVILGASMLLLPLIIGIFENRKDPSAA
ncbi:MAG: MFS transporter [Deltaproteobacteria bacterium]|jgi:YNFM family putative membrane transporter|nr:MFS transporter [Deltaproteobacteria bacterium]